MVCEKCCINISQRDYTELHRIEEHHVHPRFMDNPKGLGRKINLCRNCHIEKLHPLILQIVQRHSNLLSKKNKSANWIWKYHVLFENKIPCIDETKKFTLEWIIKKEVKNGDTKIIGI